MRCITAYHIIRAVIQRASKVNQASQIVASGVSVLNLHIFERREVVAKSIDQPLRSNVCTQVVPVRIILVVKIRIRILCAEGHQILVPADHLQIGVGRKIIHHLLHGSVGSRLSIHIRHIFAVDPLLVRRDIDNKITSAGCQLIAGCREVRSNLLQLLLCEQIGSPVVSDRILIRHLCTLIEEPAVLAHNDTL